MKSLLCFQIKGQYKAHVMDKKAHSRDNKMMRKMGLDYDSGSEERITDEEEWIQQNCPFAQSNDDVCAATDEEDTTSDDEE